MNSDIGTRTNTIIIDDDQVQHTFPEPDLMAT